jgi:hypothetical protein
MLERMFEHGPAHAAGSDKTEFFFILHVPLPLFADHSRGDPAIKSGHMFFVPALR